MLKKTIDSYQTFNDEQSARYLADHWPKGKIAGRRHDSRSIMYKYILSLSTFIKVFVGLVSQFVRNLDISQAEELLPEWEESVKIPEDIERTETISQRRLVVQRLISKIPVYNQTGNVGGLETTFQQYLRDLIGNQDIQVVSLADRPEATGDATDRFVFIVLIPLSLTLPNRFPLGFPIRFASGIITQSLEERIDNVMERVVPSFGRWGYDILTQ